MDFLPRAPLLLGTGAPRGERIDPGLERDLPQTDLGRDERGAPSIVSDFDEVGFVASRSSRLVTGRPTLW